MEEERSSNRLKAARGLRIAARVIGSFVVTIWALIVVTSIIGSIEEENLEYAVEGLSIIVIVTYLVVSTIIAWKRERLGGIMLFIGGVVFGTFGFITAGSDKFAVMSFTGLPYVVSGALFWLYARMVATKQ